MIKMPFPKKRFTISHQKSRVSLAMPKQTIKWGIVAGICIFLIAALSSFNWAPYQNARNLIGVYQAEYPVLFSETKEIKTVRKFLKIDGTGESELFEYEQCWRIEGGSGIWHHEIGGLVVSSSPYRPVEFLVAELQPTPSEGSTGLFTGRMRRSGKLDMAYAGIDKGIVFRMRPEKFRIPIGHDFSCPPTFLE